jgi:hypothetical protein
MSGQTFGQTFGQTSGQTIERAHAGRSFCVIAVSLLS